MSKVSKVEPTISQTECFVCKAQATDVELNMMPMHGVISKTGDEPNLDMEPNRPLGDPAFVNGKEFIMPLCDDCIFTVKDAVFGAMRKTKIGRWMLRIARIK